jgi:hypothetical protein
LGRDRGQIVPLGTKGPARELEADGYPDRDDGRREAASAAAAPSKAFMIPPTGREDEAHEVAAAASATAREPGRASARTGRAGSCGAVMAADMSRSLAGDDI